MKKLVLPVALLAILATSGYVLWSRPAGNGDMPPKMEKLPEDGVATGAPTITADFDLIDTNSMPVKDEDFRGRYMLVTLGYTFCPDICPASLITMTQAVQQLHTLDIAPIFITVDPERDTPAQLRGYAENFPKLIALTGTKEQTDAAAKALKFFYRYNKK